MTTNSFSLNFKQTNQQFQFKFQIQTRADIRTNLYQCNGDGSVE